MTGGRASGIELLVGHTRDEFRYFSVMGGRYGTFAEEDAHAALELLAPQPDGAPAYRAAFPQAGPDELVETVYSDALFRMPSQKLAEANAAAGGTSYLFELCWAAPALGGILGACHSLDVPLAFGTLDSPVGTKLIGELPTPEAIALSSELQEAWVRFITTGDAGWPAHRPGEHLTRVLDVEPKNPALPRTGIPPDLGRPLPGPLRSPVMLTIRGDGAMYESDPGKVGSPGHRAAGPAGIGPARGRAGCR
ncbi:hypothetical protein GCM10020001_104110 [Nonomuraea salmonea]